MIGQFYDFTNCALTGKVKWTECMFRLSLPLVDSVPDIHLKSQNKYAAMRVSRSDSYANIFLCPSLKKKEEKKIFKNYFKFEFLSFFLLSKECS